MERIKIKKATVCEFMMEVVQSHWKLFQEASEQAHFPFDLHAWKYFFLHVSKTQCYTLFPALPPAKQSYFTVWIPKELNSFDQWKQKSSFTHLLPPQYDSDVPHRRISRKSRLYSRFWNKQKIIELSPYVSAHHHRIQSDPQSQPYPNFICLPLCKKKKKTFCHVRFTNTKAQIKSRLS